MAPWFMYALLGAVAAGSVALLGRKGLEAVPPGVATAIRAIVMSVFLTAVVAVQGQWGLVRTLRAWPLTLIALSGLAGALSWLFMYKALSLAEVSRVMPIDKLSLPLGIVLAVLVLGERPTWANWAGIALMSIGALLATLPRAT
jgi:transporter family protein